MGANLRRMIAKILRFLGFRSIGQTLRGTCAAPSRRRRLCRSPGSLTIMSGVKRPFSVASDTCSKKSQWPSMPDISTVRRSCICPQSPRTFGRSQRLHETAGLIAKFLVDVPNSEICGLDLGVGFDPFGLEIGNLRVEAFQRLVERRNQVLDCYFSFVELRGGIDLEILVPLFGSLQELLGIRAQCRSRQGAEGVLQNFLGFAVCHVPALRDRKASAAPRSTRPARDRNSCSAVALPLAEPTERPRRKARTATTRDADCESATIYCQVQTARS